MRQILILFIFLVSTSLGSIAQQTKISYSDIAQGTFTPRGVYGIRSMADGEHFAAISDDRSSIVQYRYSDGAAVDTIFSNRGLTPSFPVYTYTLSEDENLVMLPTEISPIYRHSYSAENWIYDRTTGSFGKLSEDGAQQVATFSPDSKKAAFVRAGNIFVVDLVSNNTRQITSDGAKNTIINGLSDWVYEEEYGFDRAYEWSGSSDAIAYYRFDEREVPLYYMPIFDARLYPDNVAFKYPKAGERNSDVQIRVYNLARGTFDVIDEVTSLEEGYFPRIEWSGRKDELAIHKVNREQNHYTLTLHNTALHSAVPIFVESSHRYIDRIDQSKATFLPELNRVVILSEADGYRHLYLYDMSGKFQRQLTSGEWEVTSVDGVDTRSGKLYFTAARNSPLERTPYSVGIGRRGKGGGVKALRSADSPRGTYSVDFSKGCKYYIQRYSDTDTPTITTLHSTRDNGTVRTLEDNSEMVEELANFEMPTKKFITVMAADDSTQLNGYMLLPQDFDESKSYPLLMTQYSGPGSQSVSDRWSIGWESALIKEGFLVVCVDGRGTGYRGFEFRSCTYKDLGNIEVQDQIAVAKQLGELPYVDKSRIGIYGWSYGGFMSLNCILKAPEVFAAAISIAPVTTWRYYDTIYTELYNGTPQENPEGYDNNSPINFADALQGKLLLVHGTADDNVHIQNTYDMISALNDAGKDFEMIIYPDRNHSMGGDRHALMERCIEFLCENL